MERLSTAPLRPVVAGGVDAALDVADHPGPEGEDLKAELSWMAGRGDQVVDRAVELGRRVGPDADYGRDDADGGGVGAVGDLVVVDEVAGDLQLGLGAARRGGGGVDGDAGGQLDDGVAEAGGGQVVPAVLDAVEEEVGAQLVGVGAGLGGAGAA